MILDWNRLLIINFLLILCIQASSINETEIEQIRNYFYLGLENEIYLDSLQNKLEDLSKFNDDAILKAYIGAGKTVRAVHSFWPLTKLRFVKNGLNDLNLAVLKAPNNIEIRFLRFSVLHHLPSLLGYTKEAEEDAKKLFFLLIEEKNKENKMIMNVAQFLANSNRLDIEKTRELTKYFKL